MSISDKEQRLKNQAIAAEVCKAADYIAGITHPNATRARVLRAESVERYPEHLQDRIRAQVIHKFEKRGAK